jgi:hypothetical protein
MTGGGILGLLLVACAITLFQPYRITKNRAGQIGLRLVGAALVCLTIWLARFSILRSFSN